MKAGKTKLSVNVTVETIDILKEIASEYGSTIGMAVTTGIILYTKYITRWNCASFWGLQVKATK